MSFPIASIRWRAALAAALLAGVVCIGRAQESSLDLRLLDHSAVGNAQEVARLLRQGANPKAVHHRGPLTTLHLAARHGHLDVMRLLIEHGADPNAGAGRWSVLLEAAGCRNPAVTKLLLKAGAKPDGSELGQAGWLGDIETVKVLLDAGVSPDAGLPRAAQGGHRDIVRLLLAKGADVNAKDGSTALQGGLETVQLLLKAGADPNAADDQGETLLHDAISGDADIKMVKLLVESGAKLDRPNREGVTPVRLAAIRGEKAIFEWLVVTNGGTEPRPVVAPKDRDKRSTRELLAVLFSEKESRENSSGHSEN